MLVLSRKQSERIDFPGLNISVEILAVKGQTVRVGVEAPREIQILRSELAAMQDDGMWTCSQRQRLMDAMLGIGQMLSGPTVSPKELLRNVMTGLETIEDDLHESPFHTTAMRKAESTIQPSGSAAFQAVTLHR